MDFGYFGLMGYRERGTPPRRVFDEHVEQVRQADATGLAIAWFAEHHFSNYCICPSPLIMAAHCAAVTERISLAPAVIVTPLYEPARVLAEIGMVDCLSGGRLVLGVGSGYQPYEFERFGVDITKARPMLEEFLDMLHAAFASETFSPRRRALLDGVDPHQRPAGRRRPSHLGRRRQRVRPPALRAPRLRADVHGPLVRGGVPAPRCARASTAPSSSKATRPAARRSESSASCA